MSVASFLDLGNYPSLGIVVESESTALLQNETVPGTVLGSKLTWNRI